MSGVSAKATLALDAILERLRDAERIEQRSPEAALAIADEALAATDGAPPGLVRGEAWLQRARALFYVRRLAEAAESASRAEATFRALDDASGHARAATLLSAVYSTLGHYEAALETIDGAIALGDTIGLDVRARALNTRGAVLRRAGSLELAMAAFTEAVQVAHAHGEPRGLARVLLNQASAGWQVERVEEARAALARSRALIEAHALEELAGWQDTIEAWVAIAAGDFRHARAAGTRAHERTQAGGDVDARLSATRARARALALDPSSDDETRAEAAAVLEALLAEARTAGWLADAIFVCRELADVSERRGLLADTIRWLREAQTLATEAEREARRSRLSAENLRLELARLAVEAEQAHLRASELAEANTQLRAMAEERSRLLAMVAHDLRTPLTAIRFALDHQQRLGDGPSSRSLHSLIDESAERMTRLIDEALSLDAIRAGRVKIARHRLELRDLLERLASGMRPVAAQKSIELTVSGDPSLPMRSDAAAIARVVENLLTNAIKFMHGNGPVELEARARGDEALIEVRDRGPGFARSELDGALPLGAKGAARPTAGEPSSGIGLHVVRDLVRAMGGRVRLANRDDGGAHVSVWLPRGLDDEPGPAPGAAIG